MLKSQEGTCQRCQNQRRASKCQRALRPARTLRSARKSLKINGGMGNLDHVIMLPPHNQHPGGENASQRAIRRLLDRQSAILCTLSLFRTNICAKSCMGANEMLHSYAAANFQCFRERVEVDLEVTRRAPSTDWIASSASGHRILKVLGAIGPNGAGKTALLKPMAFLGWFLRDSFSAPLESDIPVQPHAAALSDPIEFECTADLDGQLWRYTLRCTPRRVLHEALYRKDERFRYVFIREWDEARQRYKVKQENFGLDPDKAETARPNVSMISWAAQYGVPLAMRLAAVQIYSNVNVLGRMPASDQVVWKAAEFFHGNELLRDEAQRLLCGWDLGLSGMHIQETEVPNPQQPDQKQKLWIPFGHHKSHGREFALPFHMESGGTKSAFALLSLLLPALHTGGLAVIDEFESDLHPHMINAILDLFAGSRTNPHNAQLVFTSHAMEVLNVLEKYHIVLVEKNAECESSAVRLDRIADARSDVNLYAKYMAGAFGAVPNL